MIEVVGKNGRASVYYTWSIKSYGKGAACRPCRKESARVRPVRSLWGVVRMLRWKRVERRHGVERWTPFFGQGFVTAKVESGSRFKLLRLLACE